MHKLFYSGLFLIRKYGVAAFDSGAGWIFLAKIIAMGFGLLFNILTFRWYGAETIGIVALITTLLVLVSSVGLMGISTSVLQFIPTHISMFSFGSARAVCKKSLLVILIFSCLISGMVALNADFFAIRIFSKPYLADYFLAASPFIVFQALLFFKTEVIRGLQSVKLYSAMLILPQGINLCLLVGLTGVLATTELPLYTCLSGIALSSLVGWAIVWALFNRKTEPNAPVSHVSTGTILRISLPMFTTTLVHFFIAYSGVMILGILRSVEEVAYFAVAIKFALLATLVVQAVNSVAGPKFAELFQIKNKQVLISYSKQSSQLVFYGSLPIILFLFLFGKVLLVQFFGNDFDAAHSALMILLCGQLVECSTGLPGMFLNMTGNQTALSKIMLFTALLNLVMNTVLIGPFGIIGAAIASVISLCFWKICSVFYIRRHFGFYFFYMPIKYKIWKKKL